MRSGASAKAQSKSKVQTKENVQQKTVSRPRKPGKKKKIIKWGIISVAVIAVIVSTAIIVPMVFAKNVVPAKTVTYNVEEISKGSVSTTVSGSGNLTPVSQKTISSEYPGTVNSVALKAGTEVTKDTVIASVTYKKTEHVETDTTTPYPSQTKTTTESTKETTEDVDITAPFDGIIIELPISEGDEFAQGDEICMIMSKDGFTMSISVDEQNISNISLNQEVKYTIDAVSGSYTGKVTEISYNGSTSGNMTAYKIKATLDYIDGVYPGMSASAKIVIKDSGEGLLVPVDALHTSGDTSYVYLAPSDAETGTEYTENEIDESQLTKATVTTGMSDGSYMLVEGNSVSEGDKIIIKKTTSSLTGSENDSKSGRGSFGGSFPGGSFPGGSGGSDFSNFDFGSFDPSNRPGGMPGSRSGRSSGGSGN